MLKLGGLRGAVWQTVFFSLLVEIEDCLLVLDFRTELLLAGEIEQVFAGVELVAILQDGVAHDVAVGFGAEDDSERGVVVFLANEQMQIVDALRRQFAGMLYRNKENDIDYSGQNLCRIFQ